ncbi:MAG: hypothetical protein Q7U74_08015 [Saprospiraceae bacterium]|nr:hypothetical protein [Saprospiraceae bacterium]
MLEFDRPSLKNRQVGELEFALFESLNPVEPDPEFLTRVRSHIDKRPSMVLETRTFWEAYVIVASGMFLGVVLLWLFQMRRH